MINIDKLIADAIISKDRVKIDTYRMMKASFIEYQKSKNAKEFDESIEAQIINNMIKQRQEAAILYKQSFRDELAANELAQIAVLKGFLPSEPSEEELKNTVKKVVVEKNKARLGEYIKKVRSIYISIDAKKIAELVLNEINS